MSDDSALESALAPLQRWFAEVMTHPESVAAGIATAAGFGVPHAAADVILPSAYCNPSERLEIYHHAYRARLIDCLRDDYPALAGALGASFAGFCRRYIASFPSASPSLNDFGRHMPEFCASQANPLATFHAELARLEWAVVEVIHAHDGPPLSLTSLATLSPDAWARCSLVPSPALRLLETQYPVNAYYQAFREQLSCDIPAPERNFTVVRRRAAMVVREPQSALDSALLRSLLAGEPIGQALETAAAGGMTAEQVGSCFERWMGSGYFVTEAAG